MNHKYFEDHKSLFQKRDLLSLSKISGINIIKADFLSVFWDSLKNTLSTHFPISNLLDVKSSSEVASKEYRQTSSWI